MAGSELELALERARLPGRDVSSELMPVGNAAVETRAEAEGVLGLLGDLLEAAGKLTPCGKPAISESDGPVSQLHMIASLFQRAGNREVYDLLAGGAPTLRALYDAHLALADRDDGDLLFVLKVLSMFPGPDGLDRLVSALAAGLGAEDPLWGVIFNQFDAEHPQRLELLARVGEQIPPGFAGVAYADYANALALAGELESHPFDGELGATRLEGWLRGSDPDAFSYAHTATAALPFVSRPARDGLLALALDHTDPRVQLEAAWASGRVGSEGGIKFLARLCLDSRWSRVAQTYLAELDREEAIPAEVTEPTFSAEVELCDWLTHPHEYGRPPESVRLVDTRRLRWPPTDDERQVWLFEYAYADAEEPHPKKGIAMVGAITFSLFGETNPDQDPEDVYALHCCWELEVAKDPRTPEIRSVEAGRRLLFGA
jgi:hypothetical protein